MSNRKFSNVIEFPKKPIAPSAPVPTRKPFAHSRVIKAEDLHKLGIPPLPTVTPQVELLGSRIAPARPQQALSGLKDQLGQLKTLQQRLKFLLTEIEEFSKS